MVPARFQYTMHLRTSLLFGLVAACGCTSARSDFDGAITSWADHAKFGLSEPRPCRVIDRTAPPFGGAAGGAQVPAVEDDMFGVVESTCWSARARYEQSPAGSQMFPRLVIHVTTYQSEAAAKARMSAFHDVPRTLVGEAEKTYPLRAGFRAGTRVVVVTTDALVFEHDLQLAARQLAQTTGGSDFTCWGACKARS
jgi:hypothetical protein